jgi:glyoxylase-like metal-dependent hydrolase (beta-lactamase superfamily II)
MTPPLRWVLAPNPSPMTLDGTRTYIIGRSRPVVIDPGPADPAHLRALVAALAGTRPVAVLLTHGHPDHAEAGAELGAISGAPVLAAASTAENGADPHGGLEDGRRFETDVGVIEAVSTPGHSPDHFAFSWRGAEAPVGGGAVFVGDLILGAGDASLVAWPEGDVAHYLQALDRILELNPSILYPAHGPPVTEVERVVERFRSHRLARVEEVMDAVRKRGSASADQLVDEIYGERLDPRLRWAAEASLRASLEHLAGTRAIVRRGKSFGVPADDAPSPSSRP